MSPRRERIVFFSFFIISFCLFYIKNVFFLDPDFGWYLKLGELIVSSGIPAVDPFSYTMPSYPFIDHEWAANILIYVMHGWGKYILDAFFALLPIVTLFIVLRGKYKIEYLPVLILSSSVLIFFAGIRVQEISWLFFAVLLCVLFSEKTWLKFRFFIPFLILAWVNLHGGFALGIAFLALFIFTRIIEKTATVKDLAVFGLSCLAVFINPYGVLIFPRVFLELLNPSLHFGIAEWLPGVFFWNFGFFFLLAVSFAFLIKGYAKMSLFQIAVIIVLIFMGISSVRHIPLLIIGNLAVTPFFIDNFSAALTRKEQKKRWSKVILVWIFISVLIAGYNFYAAAFAKGLSQEKYYPSDKILSVLLRQKDCGEVFADYTWGGYLVWKAPQRKIFVNGLMPAWHFDAPPGQSDSAFADYQDIMLGEKSYKPIFNKYNVRCVLLRPHIEEKSSAIDLLDVFSGGNKDFSLKKALLGDGWKKIAGDNTAEIFVSR